MVVLAALLAVATGLPSRDHPKHRHLSPSDKEPLSSSASDDTLNEVPDGDLMPVDMRQDLPMWDEASEHLEANKTLRVQGEGNITFEIMSAMDEEFDAKTLAKMCGPGESNFWVLGSNHKTGTELLDGILTIAASWKGGSSGLVSPVSCNDRGDEAGAGDVPKGAWKADFKIDTGCVNSAHSSTQSIVRVRRMLVTKALWEQRVADWHNSRKLRALLMVRDPIEVIKSAYFYDVVGGEPAPRQVPSNMLPGATKVVCNYDPDGVLCRRLKGFGKSTSWMQALQKLPPKLGIVAEAAYELSGLTFLANTSEAFAATPEHAHRVDLTKMMSNFDVEIKKMFQFLGVSPAHLDTCAKACKPLDIKSTRGVGESACIANYTSAAKAAEIAHNKKKLDDAKILDHENWYETYVLAYHKLLPSECVNMGGASNHEVLHSFDSAMTPIKAKVDTVLKSSSFFKEMVAPLRASMGYH